MKRRWVILAAGAWLAASAAALAFDTVKLKPTGTVVGEVTNVTPLEVTVKQGALDKKVPVNEIDTIFYEGEPSSLNVARMNARAGRYEDALKLLTDPQKINPAEIDRDLIKQDVDYYTAMCNARLALAGTGAITDAGRALVGFLEKQPQSYHSFAACELVGDLLVADGKYATAEKYYLKLADTPWPDYRMRAGVAVGRAQLAENKLAEAEKSFDGVLAIGAEGDLADFQRMAATLGKARCLAEKGNTQDAQKMVQNVIAKADPEYGELHARAYNTLGAIERKAGHAKEAILAFLHVDILYFSHADEHAEALANLEQLWNDVHKPERAIKARQILDTRYKNSPWARQKGG